MKKLTQFVREAMTEAKSKPKAKTVTCECGWGGDCTAQGHANRAKCRNKFTPSPERDVSSEGGKPCYLCKYCYPG